MRPIEFFKQIGRVMRRQGRVDVDLAIHNVNVLYDPTYLERRPQSLTLSQYLKLNIHHEVMKMRPESTYNEATHIYHAEPCPYVQLGMDCTYLCLLCDSKHPCIYCFVGEYPCHPLQDPLRTRTCPWAKFTDIIDNHGIDFQPMALQAISNSEFFGLITSHGFVDWIKQQRAKAAIQLQPQPRSRDQSLEQSQERSHDQSPNQSTDDLCRSCLTTGDGEWVECSSKTHGCDESSHWYHYVCIGLPTGTDMGGNRKWYCPRCRLDGLEEASSGDTDHEDHRDQSDNSDDDDSGDDDFDARRPARRGRTNVRKTKEAQRQSVKDGKRPMKRKRSTNDDEGSPIEEYEEAALNTQDDTESDVDEDYGRSDKGKAKEDQMARKPQDPAKGQPSEKQDKKPFTPYEKVSTSVIMGEVVAANVYGKRAYELVSARLSASYGVRKDPGQVKNYWSRHGRQATGYDERIIKNPGKLQTSKQDPAARRLARQEKRKQAEAAGVAMPSSKRQKRA